MLCSYRATNNGGVNATGRRRDHWLLVIINVRFDIVFVPGGGNTVYTRARARTKCLFLGDLLYFITIVRCKTSYSSFVITISVNQTVCPLICLYRRTRLTPAIPYCDARSVRTTKLNSHIRFLMRTYTAFWVITSYLRCWFIVFSFFFFHSLR